MEDLQEKISRVYYAVGKQPQDVELKKIMNPGAKSKKSFLSKVVRKMQQEGKTNLKLQDFTDMCRGAILFDSYKEIPQFLLAMKKEIPSLDGYICRTGAGYKGVHLNFVIDGVAAEVQLSTYKAWPVKDAGEVIYQEVRDFDQDARNSKIVNEERILEVLEEQYRQEPSEELGLQIQQQCDKINGMKAALKETIERNKALNNLSVDMFDTLHSDGDFYSVEQEIESILKSFSFTLMPDQKKTSPVLDQGFKLNEFGQVDLEHAGMLIDDVLPLTTRVQESLVKSMEASIVNADKVIDSDSQKWISYSNFITSYQNRYTSEIQTYLPPEIIEANQETFSRHCDTVTAYILNYAISRNIDLSNISEVITSFNMEVQQFSDKFPDMPPSILDIANKMMQVSNENQSNMSKGD